MLVPPHVARLTLEAELAAIEAWSFRWSWQVDVDLDLLLLRFATTHPLDRQPIYLTADLNGYKAVPPAWMFVHTDGTTDLAAWPAPGPLPTGSVFHSHPTICAPWNRLAYKELGGVHEDWAGTANWLNVMGHTRATTVPDMLSIIRANLAVSPGRMS